MAERTQALDEVVWFTSDLIRIDTTNRGGGDCQERPAAEYAAALLAEAGLDAHAAGDAPGAVPTSSPGSRAPTPPPTRCSCTVTSTSCPRRPADWSVHPFSGEIRDGVVWGRGAVDMKNMDAMILAVVRAWARAGSGPGATS